MIASSTVNAIRSVLPKNARTASKSWLSFNAPCCVHRGESADRRHRGGILFTHSGGVRYHCFNCNYRAGWEPGSRFNPGMRRLMRWMGMSESDVQTLVFSALRNLDSVVAESVTATAVKNFQPRELPICANIAELLQAGAADISADLATAVDYIRSRGFDVEEYDWRWSPETHNALNRRVIIPFNWRGETIGYCARSVAPNSRLRYINQIDSDFVFNTDAVKSQHEFVLVTEGVFDAIALGAVAVLTNEVSDAKAEIIENLGKRVIVVPDRDSSGQTLVNAALEYGWNVSFPLWESDIKDAADACLRYGRLYTLRSILAGAESNSLKISLLSKELFGSYDRKRIQH